MSASTPIAWACFDSRVNKHYEDRMHRRTHKS